MKKPNFFIVGAAKAGTTSVYNFLKNHSKIYMSPIKEPHYFSKDIRCENFDKKYQKFTCFDISKYFLNKPLKELHAAYIDNLHDYLKLFEDVNDEKIIGEASVGYLYSEVAAKEIFKFNSNSKILIILRHPVDRAFSHWLMDLRQGLNYEKNFEKALEKDYFRKKKGWGISHLYVELGLYYKQVKRYLEIFPSSNIKVMLYDELKNDPESFMCEIFDFIELDYYKFNNEKFNKAMLPKNYVIYKVLRSFYNNLGLSFLLNEKSKNMIKNFFMSDKNIPKLDNKLKNKLFELYFREDVLKLKNLLKMDLNEWFE